MLRLPLLPSAGAVALSLLSVFGCCNRNGNASNPAASIAKADAPASDAPSDAAVQRCRIIGRPYAVGKASSNEANLDIVLPFATEIGHGIAMASGFAVGALRQRDNGTEAVVITANEDGSSWRTIVLGPSHGDAESPLVFRGHNRWGVAILEPAGTLRHLRIAYIDINDNGGKNDRGDDSGSSDNEVDNDSGTNNSGDSNNNHDIESNDEEVQWRSEILQGTDESRAFDVAVGKRQGIVVWDDVVKNRKISGIYLSTFHPKTFRNPTSYRVMTDTHTDADTPRIVQRQGGYWLFWIARKAQQNTEKEDDTRYRAEEISYQWLEAMPLDEHGKAVAGTAKLTPENGHLKDYDVVTNENDIAVVYYRDDDTPTGSSGGQLYRMTVSLGGAKGPHRLQEQETAQGTPGLLIRWLAISDTRGATGLVPLADDGAWQGELINEPLLGAGIPVASRKDDILVARPDGIASRLTVLRCDRTLRSKTDKTKAEE